MSGASALRREAGLRGRSELHLRAAGPPSGNTSPNRAEPSRDLYPCVPTVWRWRWWWWWWGGGLQICCAVPTADGEEARVRISPAPTDSAPQGKKRLVKQGGLRSEKTRSEAANFLQKTTDLICYSVLFLFLTSLSLLTTNCLLYYFFNVCVCNFFKF